MTSKCAIYLRVSTQEQNTDLQKSELAAYMSARGWTDFIVYEDKSTGTNTQRSEFQRMLRDARARKFKTLLVWKFDRFARSLKDLITHLQELDELGVVFISLKDQIDFSTSTGRLMLHIIGAFSEFEASIIKERVTAGVRAKIAKTGRWGPLRKRDDQTIVALRKNGFSIRQIAKRLGISATSVMRGIQGSPMAL